MERAKQLGKIDARCILETACNLIDHAGRVELRLAPDLALEAVFGEILGFRDTRPGMPEGIGDLGCIVADG